MKKIIGTLIIIAAATVIAETKNVKKTESKSARKVAAIDSHQQISQDALELLFSKASQFQVDYHTGNAKVALSLVLAEALATNARDGKANFSNDCTTGPQIINGTKVQLCSLYVGNSSAEMSFGATVEYRVITSPKNNAKPTSVEVINVGYVL